MDKLTLKPYKYNDLFYFELKEKLSLPYLMFSKMFLYDKVNWLSSQKNKLYIYIKNHGFFIKETNYNIK